MFGMKKRIRKQTWREMRFTPTLLLALFSSCRGIWTGEVDTDQLTVSDRPVLP